MINYDWARNLGGRRSLKVPKGIGSTALTMTVGKEVDVIFGLLVIAVAVTRVAKKSLTYLRFLGDLDPFTDITYEKNYSIRAWRNAD